MHQERSDRNNGMRSIQTILADVMSGMAKLSDLGEGEVPPPGSDYRSVLNFIRGKYAHHERLGIRPSAYFIDWPSLFTPIESAAWGAIRYTGLPMVPQYPIGPFFADFADPDTRVVIECDGKQFHQDKERDASRDRFMADKGWTVFRITGRECMAPEIDWEEISYLIADQEADKAEWLIEDWILSSAEGLVSAIGVQFYGKRLTKVEPKFIAETLRRHCTAQGAK